jgi:hypothetical protein
MGPCPAYTRERLEELAAGRESLTVVEILGLDIPARDKMWVVLREPVLGTELYRAFGHACADRAVERHALHCGIPKVEQWAARWLSGKAATKAAAKAARNAASAAAWNAARSAAWSAEAAAEAAIGDAAGDAVWSAGAAAGAAAGDAIGAAAGTTEREWQVQKLKELLR